MQRSSVQRTDPLRGAGLERSSQVSEAGLLLTDAVVCTSHAGSLQRSVALVRPHPCVPPASLECLERLHVLCHTPEVYAAK